MKNFFAFLFLSVVGLFYAATPAAAQSTVVQACGTLPLAYLPGATRYNTVDVNGNACIAGTFSQTGGTVSNATSGQATTATNQGAVSYLYGFNGTTWDQLQVDASKFLKVNCTVGCAAGTFNNNSDAVATSATNGQVAAWLYGFNGVTWDRLQVDASKQLKVVAVINGPVGSTSQYPFGAVPITASATGTTAATTATLAASVSIKTYICGFSIRANATAAATANSTVTGTITGTMNYTQWTAPLASGLGITEQIFAPCVPSSAINTAIAVISAAPGAGGVVSVSAWGYQL